LLTGGRKRKRKRRELEGEGSPAYNQPNNLSPPYISDLKSISIALYASAATILSEVALSLSLGRTMPPARP
jgi:hypothetical protein